MRVEAAAGLGRDHRALAATLLKHGGNDLFGASVTIDVGRVDEGDAAVERRIQRALAVRFADVAPGAADLPGAEADLGNRRTRLAQNSRFHDDHLLGELVIGIEYYSVCRSVL
ncbi:hypothetical protein D3C87_1775960 [compost metagenome]